MTEPPPPWTVFPSLSPDVPPTQGAEEAYIDLDWLPFWSAQTSEAKASYLDRWEASPAWREAIHARYDPPEFDIAEDAADSAAWLRAHRPKPKPPSRFARWFRRKG